MGKKEKDQTLKNQLWEINLFLKFLTMNSVAGKGQGPGI